ncbi:MAG: hypothetical protein WED04_11955 [Promethearchaeati archaeon SRVP18_Atabeyarchaeia-1]
MTEKKDDKSAPVSTGPKTYHIVRGNLVEEKSTQFYEGDTYVIDNGLEIYIWLGKESSVDEEFAGAFTAEQLDLSRRGAPKVTTVDQGKEPKKLLEILGPNFKVVPGGVEGMLKKVEPTKEIATTLYKASDGKLTKVQIKSSALGTRDCFILENAKMIYVWEGKNSTAKDKYMTGHAARELNSKRKFMVPIKVIGEGEEPEEFLNNLK